MSFSPQNQPLRLLGGSIVHLRKYKLVEVAGNRGLRVAQAVGHYPSVDATCEPRGGVRVPQAVE